MAYLEVYPPKTIDYSALYENNVLFLFGEIEDGQGIVETLIGWNLMNPDKLITMYINSGGGFVADGMSIYETMQRISNPVRTICVGEACSIASILLLAGTKGERYMTKYSWIMMHQSSMLLGGDTDTVYSRADMMKRQEE